MNYIVEVATTDFSTTEQAVIGGADRIELCTSLVEGGVTPSFGTIKLCREKFALPIFPIIRPRAGDFLYSDEEYEVMRQDILMCKQLGCDGVVLGLLTYDGIIEVDRTARLIEVAYPLEVTFHRAYDRCRDPFEALEQLIQVGCQRILTSGQKPTAPEGAELIARLMKAADERIIIMPGSGVRQENIRELRDKTGAVEFHTSLRSKQKSRMAFVHPAFANSEESYANPAISIEGIKNLKDSLAV